MYFLELVGQFLRDMRARKLRTALAVFGIAWGTVAVVLLLSVGDAFHATSSRAFHGMGEDLVIMWPSQTTKAYKGMQPGPWDLHLVPDAAPALGVFDGDLDSGLALAIDSSPAYRRGQLRLQSTDLQVELARDRTRPQVYLIARVGVTGIGGSYADNVEVLSEAEGRSWRGGVTLGFPLGHNSDRERLYQRVLEKQRDEVDLERVRLDIVRQVREQHRRVGINHRRVEVSQLAERLAEQNVTEEEDRLTLGLSTVRQVLDAQDDLAESRRRLQAIVGYNKALVEWRRLTGA